jgi:asparagine synthase (glutamine-hydrolysing)
VCGIAGFWGPSFQPDEAAATLRRMTDAIRHRGPDDEGQWLDPEAGVALGHRRLSILDLSPEGHQPMVSAGGRFVVVFNGEIYNWQDLRREEEAHGTRFRGHSDTEVMLAVFERLGVAEGVRALVGMFAFALWDRQERELHLVRDRMGEKPLYYGRVGDTVLFGSELKALRAHPAWQGDLDRTATTLYLRYGYVPAPRSIYRGIGKVRPGTLVTYRDRRPEPREMTYWSAAEAAVGGAAVPSSAGATALEDHLDELLRRVVARQMIADVPLGAFLSGGIDSSLVVALMQAQSDRPVRTFTIGFHEAQYNEADHARGVASHLGTDHTELYVTPAEAMAVVPRLPEIYDEPFGDCSQVPTHLVAALARSQVTVSLSGDGGDEVFGGYHRYFLTDRWWNRIRRLPPASRVLLGHGLRAMRPDQWDRAILALGLGHLASRPTGDRVHKLAGVLGARTLDDLYRGFVSQWPEPATMVVGGEEPETGNGGLHGVFAQGQAFEQMMLRDSLSYLPDDILVKVDRATMAVSLESRAPFLDHEVFAFAWRLPRQLKVGGGRGKLILRRLLTRYVPSTLFERPKMGFGVPIDMWLRGPLRPWVEELLDERRLRDDGVLRPEPIRRAWREHLRGLRNWQYPLWVVLMFQAWREKEASAGRLAA